MSSQKALFISGSINQTSVTHAAERELESEMNGYFTSLYPGDGLLRPLLADRYETEYPIPHVVTLIQAQTESSRLPNKVLRPILGKPLLSRLLERVRRARYTGTVAVITTNEVEDDGIELLCLAEEVICVRGHPTDLLDRYFEAATLLDADTVVKIPSNCPLIDPHIIDRVIGTLLDKPDGYDYVSNLHPATYPEGNGVEVMTVEALEAAWREATPLLWEHPDRFRLGNVTWESGLDLSSSHRWTVDFEEDYQFVTTVYERIYAHNPGFGLQDILTLLEREPALAQINANYAAVN
jgi:spore coat polysaccharide biosynthesis protein SpsF